MNDKVSNECPKCGTELDGESFTWEEVFIDPDLGFVALTRKCSKCRKEWELFFDYNRIEKKDE